MIIKELINLYDRLAEKNIVKLCWNMEKVAYGIEIDNEGNVIPPLIPLDEGKQPHMANMPIRWVKDGGTGDFPRFCWGSCRYVLGFEKNKKFKSNNPISESNSQFNDRSASMKSEAIFHEELLSADHSDVAEAIKSFYNKHSDASTVKKLHEELGLDETTKKQIADKTLVLYFSGKPVTEYGNIVAAWDRKIVQIASLKNDGKEELPFGTSLATGEKGYIARTHPPIRGTGKQNPSLIGFNSPSFESYGLKQSNNAPVLTIEAMKYAAALNYLIKTRDNRARIGDAFILSWAETANKEYENIFDAFMFDNPASLDEKTLHEIIRKITKGERADYNSISIDPSQRFLIAGIKPNGAGRLAVTFFYENSFGFFIRNIENHYERMRISARKDTLEGPGITKVLKHLFFRIKEDKWNDRTGVYRQTGERLLRSVLLGEMYPPEVLDLALQRIAWEHSKSDDNGKKVIVQKVRSLTAQIIKAYMINNHPETEKTEVQEMGLIETSKNKAYLLGRLFATLERLQANAGSENYADRYFNTAMTEPSEALPQMIGMIPVYTKKLKKGSQIFYDREITAILAKYEGDEYPAHLTQKEQASFCLGYYHQKQKLFTKDDAKSE